MHGGSIADTDFSRVLDTSYPYRANGVEACSFFRNANLTGANYRSSCFPVRAHVHMCARHSKRMGAQYSSFEGANLSSTNFTECTIKHCNMTRCNLWWTMFTEAETYQLQLDGPNHGNQAFDLVRQ